MCSALVAMAWYVSRTGADMSVASYTTGQFTVIDRPTYDRRTIRSERDGRVYFLYPEEEVQVGQSLWLSDHVDPAFSLSIRPQRTKISVSDSSSSSSSFSEHEANSTESINNNASLCLFPSLQEWLPVCIEDWTYDFRFDRWMVMKGVHGTLYQPSMVVW